MTAAPTAKFDFQRKVFCIISDVRVHRSRSPEMFTHVLKRVGMKASYVPFCVDPACLGEALNSLRVLKISGANVTVPYKEKVVPHLDILSEGANIIGAVNTIVCKDGTLKGYNTNAIGVMDTLEKAGFNVPGCRALVFGTGGAARAVVFILNWLRAGSIYIAGRNPENVKALIDHIGGQAIAVGQLEAEKLPLDIVVNATAASSPDESPHLARLTQHLTTPGCRLMLDLNYGRSTNFWQDWALRHDTPFMDGLFPLAYQAKRTFALWTGIDVAPQEFIDALAV
ncbi:MAG: shikimate dehydrogenase [Desulfosarcinaceae bacterium]